MRRAGQNIDIVVGRNKCKKKRYDNTTPVPKSKTIKTSQAVYGNTEPKSNISTPIYPNDIRVYQNLRDVALGQNALTKAPNLHRQIRPFDDPGRDNQLPLPDSSTDTDGPTKQSSSNINSQIWNVDLKTEDNDDLAAMIFRVLLDNGGCLKVQEFESKLFEEPLMMKFPSCDAFVDFIKSYDRLFTLKDSIESEGEEGEIGLPEIMAATDLEIHLCPDHSSIDARCKGGCGALHFCKFKLLSECNLRNCKFGHNFDSNHNIEILSMHLMHRLLPDQIKSLIKRIQNRRGVVVPVICRFYNTEQGCRNEASCPFLHLCKYIAEKCAFFPRCKRSHDLCDVQPQRLFTKYGIDTKSTDREEILHMIRRACPVLDHQPVPEIKDGEHAQNLPRRRSSEDPRSVRPSQFRWTNPFDVYESLNEFAPDENEALEKAYAEYMKAKMFTYTVGRRKIMLDFSKMRGTITEHRSKTEIDLRLSSDIDHY